MSQDESSPLLEGNEDRLPILRISQASLTQSHSKKALLSMFLPMTIGLFLVAADGTVVASSYAAIGNEMKELQKASWISTAYLLTLTSFQPMYGRLSLIYGKKRTLLFAYIVFTIGCLCCGFAKSINQLALSRALAGVGGGGISTVTTVIITTFIPIKSRGTWQGILNLVFSVGSAVGGPFGGFLSDHLGWRWSFHLQVPAMALAIIMVYLNLQLPESEVTDWKTGLQRLDLLGASTLTLAVTSVLFGFELLGDLGYRSKKVWVALIISLFLFLAFLVIEFKIAVEPIAPSAIVLEPSLCAAYLANFFAVGASMSLFFYVPLYIQAVMGKSAAQTGALLLPSVAGGAIGSLSGGLLVQMTGDFYYQTILGYAALLIGSIAVIFTSSVFPHSVAALSVGFAVAGYGNGHGITTCFIALISTVNSDDQAIATSVSYLFRSLGSVIWLAVGSALVQGILAHSLPNKLPKDTSDQLLHCIRESLDFQNSLDEATKQVIRDLYKVALQSEFFLICLLALCAICCSIAIKPKAL
ncbi:hypothetical protein GYMLUDRAFT_70990 [Collybiopsis luxurians FD-317 M1]|nr:hypothetical protein GYMLUDRAFT_70990 [Collybiopsis luxurians FD-317 M1]